MPKRISHEEHIKRLTLLGRGYSDLRIAKECGVKHQTIAQWRYRNDLPANFRLFDTRNNKFV